MFLHREEITAEAAGGVQPARLNQVPEELGEVVLRWALPLWSLRFNQVVKAGS